MVVVGGVDARVRSAAGARPKPGTRDHQVEQQEPVKHRWSVSKRRATKLWEILSRNTLRPGVRRSQCRRTATGAVVAWPGRSECRVVSNENHFVAVEEEHSFATHSRLEVEYLAARDAALREFPVCGEPRNDVRDRPALHVLANCLALRDQVDELKVPHASHLPNVPPFSCDRPLILGPKLRSQDFEVCPDVVFG